MKWEDALRKVCLEHRDDSFEYGRWDCCQFVRAYVKELTGRDYGAELAYSGEFGAARLLKSHGDIEGLLTSLLGQPSAPCEGSIVSLNGGAVGVFVGPYTIAVGEKGMVRSTEPVVSAWTVECHPQ